jgi:peptidoglycan-associated lipoprotein
LEGRPRIADEEDGAASLLQDGLTSLNHGRTRAGQRTLELLIARYPESAAADVARRRLVAMYGPASAAYGQQSPALERAASDMTPTPRPAAAIAADPGAWRVDVRRNSAAIEDFRAKAGDRVFFSAGSAELGGRARSVLQAQARWLNHHVAEGHADDPGDSEANAEIARRRAAAVRDRLIEEGVAAERVVIIVRGNTDRVAECATTACAAQNRRVVTAPIATEPPDVPIGTHAMPARGEGSDRLR